MIFPLQAKLPPGTQNDAHDGEVHDVTANFDEPDTKPGAREKAMPQGGCRSEADPDEEPRQATAHCTE